MFAAQELVAVALSIESEEALLLDETEVGFYLLDRNTGHSYFLPRTEVGLLEFKTQP